MPLPLSIVLVLAAPASDLEAKVKRIFADNCTSCHSKGGEEPSLSGSPSRLISMKSRATGKPFVTAGDPAASYLVAKINGKGIKGDLMPLGGDPLTGGQKKAIKDWIVSLAPAADASPPGVTPPTGDGAPTPVGTPEGTPTTTPDPAAGDGVATPVDGATTSTVGADGSSGAASTTVSDGGSTGSTGAADAPSDEPAEDGDDEEKKGQPPFHGVFQINLPSTSTLGKRVFEFRIDHRFGRVGTERGAFGIDAGANISYGFAYGIFDGWDVLLRRSNSRKGYELGTKYMPVRQEAGKPLSFGGYASVEYLRDFPSNTANPWAGSFQLLLSRLWFERWSTQLVVSYSLRTNHKVGPTVDFDDGKGAVKVKDKRGSLGVGLASTVWLGKRKRWGIDMEYYLPIPSDKFFYNGGNADPNGSNIGSWSLGGSVRTARHFFQIFMTNTREIHTNLYAPGGQSKNPFENRGNFFLGFNLSRQWSL
jgi:mono/diheme cytochrome c family protein